MRAKLAGLFLLLLGLNARASDLFAPFQGSRMSGLTRSSTIAEYDGTTDASGNLLDLSGSNYALQSQDFSTTWAVNTYASIVTNSIRAPDGTLTADSLKEYGAGGGGGAGDSHTVSQNMTMTQGYAYTHSVYVKPAARTIVMLRMYHATDDAYCYFTLTGSGTRGNSIGNPVCNISRVNGDWYKISLEKYQAAATGTRTFTIYASVPGGYSYAGSDQVALYLWGAQTAKNDQWRQGPGIYHPTTTVTKPLHDLAPWLAPTPASSYLQDQDGNRLTSRYLSGTPYYSVAHHDSLNIGDQDFTVTAVAMKAVSGGTRVLGHSNTNIGGFSVSTATGDPFYYSFVFNKTTGGAASTFASAPTTSAIGRYQVVQAVRKSNIAIIGADGSFGSPINVTGYGEDLSTGWYVGRDTPGAIWNGNIQYVRVDSVALTQKELAKDREALQGTLTGSGNLSPGWTFTRTTTASMTYANGTIGYVAANVPRVGGDGGGVLVEEQRENKALQSQTFGTTWGKRAGDGISADSATILAPDGTATADGIIAENVNEDHYLYQSIAMTAAAWSTSVWAKPGNKNWIRLANSTVGTSAYFNVANCTAGTTAGILYARTEKFVDGWCRCQVAYTATAATTATSINSAEADGDDTFAGDGATVNTWYWGAQVETGAHPTSYITTTSAAVTRTQDSLTMEPWKLNKGVNPGLANPTMTARFESDVYATGTYTSETGAYAFTAAGDVKRQASQTLGDWFAFDGTGDYLTVADSTFNPAGDFTVTAIYTPSNVVGSQAIASKWNINSDQRGWVLYQNTTGVSLSRSTDGQVGTQVTATAASALTAGKTCLITASYSTTAGLSVWVDGYTVGTQAATGVVHPSTANFEIGRAATPDSYVTGKIHSVKYIPGYAATQTDHDNAYAQFKQANALPVKVGNSYEAKKLYVEFDAKCLYPSGATMGPATSRSLVTISGNTGTALVGQNYANVFLTDGGNARAGLVDNGTTSKYLQGATYNNYYDKWHHYAVKFDGANMASSTFTVDGFAHNSDGGTMINASDFDLNNTQIRVGQAYNGTTNANCRVKNLRVRAAP